MEEFDWVSRLFQGGEQTRGLSGAGAGDVATDHAGGFYNYRLRRHRSADDVVAGPLRMWAGLAEHLASATAGWQDAWPRPFTDALVVLSAEDWDRATADDATFVSRTAALLGEAWADHRRGEGALAPGHLAVWLVQDGSAELAGTSFGLGAGEYVTGVVPNLYRSPGPATRAAVVVHANLPGVWEGYREVGRIYEDQVLFTLGSHWLDNVSYPSLGESALLAIRFEVEAGGGRIRHLLNPDHAGRYQVLTTDQDGVTVLTLATVDGRPLAYVVPWAIEEESAQSAQSAPVSEMSVDDALPELALDEVELDTLEPPDDAARPVRRGPRTILSEGVKDRIFTLLERGVLLQKVHFGAFMSGYDVYLGRRGEVATVVAEAAATFQVRKKSVSLYADVAGVSLNGQVVPRGEARPIEGDAIIEFHGHRFDFRDLRGVAADSWPYLAEIRRPASSTYMLWGRSYVIGRSRESRVVLPDQPHNGNIVWKPEVAEGSTVRTKHGEIPKARFYTDSIMVASEHAALDLSDEAPQIVCKAKECHVFVRHGEGVSTLYPTTSGKGAHERALEPGDEILIGNCLFQVSYTPTTPAAAPTEAAPSVRALGDTLWGDSDLPVDELDAPAPPPALLGHKSQAWADLPDVFDEAPVVRPKVVGGERRRPLSVGDLPDLDGPPPAWSLPQTLPARIEPVVDAADAAPSGVSSADAAPLEPDAPADPMDAPVAALHGPSLAPAGARTDAPGASARGAEGAVVAVDEQDARFELGRPARIALVGWVIQGSATVGNTAAADVVVPENRMSAGQRFEPRTYVTLHVRGRRGSAQVHLPSEVRVDGELAPHALEGLEGRHIGIVRRDDRGEEDFLVDLELGDDPSLPDPRARLLRLDTSDPMVRALSVRGAPLRAARTITLGPLGLTLRFDGERLVVEDYLASYQREGGYQSFFVARGGERYRTAPEDGGPIALSRGDRLITGNLVWEVEVD